MKGDATGFEVFVAGLSHLSAPVGVRERVALQQADLPSALAFFRATFGLEEAAVLSTCSRFELVAVSQDPDRAIERLAAWLRAQTGTDVAPFLYFRRGYDAVEHCLRVAAGLDSWILGETEILGQVRQAYELASRTRNTGRILNILFQRALHAGKEVRAKTRIAQGVVSVGGAAAVLARRVFGEVGATGLVVFGAGAMAESVTRHLLAKGVQGVYVANRTLARAAELAGQLGGAALTLEQGLERLAEADIAIFSTASPCWLLRRLQAEEIMRRRNGRPLFLIDIGVPRNVDPAAGQVPGVHLTDIDELKGLLEASRSQRKGEVERASRMCQALAQECRQKLAQRSARLGPLEKNAARENTARFPDARESERRGGRWETAGGPPGGAP